MANCIAAGKLTNMGLKVKPYSSGHQSVQYWIE